MALRGWIVLVAFGSALTPGCKREAKLPDAPPVAALPEPPTVVPSLGAVELADLTPDELRPEGVRLDTTDLRETARAVLESSGLFAPADPKTPVANVAIGLVMEHVRAGDKGAARLGTRLEILVKPRDAVGEHWNENLQIASEATYVVDKKKPPDLAGTFAKLAHRTVRDVLDQYVARIRLRKAEPAELLRVMKDEVGELQEEAIRIAGERRLGEAVPQLLALLEHPDERVRDMALGSLVRLREQKAVAVLTKSRSLRDKREMRKIVEAVAALGGPEARDYLDFVAEAHEDEELKKLARDALARLKRREAPSAAN